MPAALNKGAEKSRSIASISASLIRLMVWARATVVLKIKQTDKKIVEIIRPIAELTFASNLNYALMPLADQRDDIEPLWHQMQESWAL